MSDELAARVPKRLTLPAPPALPFPAVAPVDWVRPIRLMLLTGITLYAIAFTARAYVRSYFTFLPDYARWMFTGTAPVFRAGATHVFVLFTDHFEPDYDEARVDEWARRYRALAARHRDSAGRPPQHTWFYPGEQYDRRIYDTLHDLTAAGYGEVEMHFHHAYDTYGSLRDSLRDAIEDFTRFGFLRTVDGKTAFAFIHGNSGLDDSNGEQMCGVRREIQLLHELGCYGDFTFPSLFEPAQPSRVNSIYATRDDDLPKSYDLKLPLTALRDGTAQLMMFQGPLIFSPTLNMRQLFLHLEDGDIHANEHATPARADSWVRANVHVPQRPDWVFVKLFAHGASSPAEMDAVLGDDFDAALSYLESEYNDGSRYVLHYVTAREAYNLARAAGEGAQGAPQRYLDAYIRPYVANVGGGVPPADRP